MVVILIINHEISTTMKKKQIKSLNESLPEFFLEDLEQRLETDPLNVGALVSLYDPAMQSGGDACGHYTVCEEYKGCNNVTICNINF